MIHTQTLSIIHIHFLLPLIALVGNDLAGWKTWVRLCSSLTLQWNEGILFIQRENPWQSSQNGKQLNYCKKKKSNRVTAQRILKAGTAGRGRSLPPAHWHSMEGGVCDAPGQEQTLLKNNKFLDPVYCTKRRLLAPGKGSLEVITCPLTSASLKRWLGWLQLINSSRQSPVQEPSSRSIERPAQPCFPNVSGQHFHWSAGLQQAGL